MTARYAICAIGNAIVDVLAKVDDAFIAREALAKGSMRLIDEVEATRLYAALPPSIESSGGSAANTVAGVASFGLAAAFIGRVRDDQLGEVFIHDLRGAGVNFDTPAARNGAATARCLVLVTPDAQRTMNTFLGASTGLAPRDIDHKLVRDSAVLYLEGYLLDPPEARAAMFEAAKTARAAGRKIALSLSDGFVVDRHRATMQLLLREGVDILFANENEAKSLAESDSFETTTAKLKDICPMVCLTRSEQGSTIFSGGHSYAIPAQILGAVVDTTGAGDLYAAGVLAGLARGLGPAEAGRLGALAAGEVISHLGARPQTRLADLAQKLAA